jgi:hypothetical protein
VYSQCAPECSWSTPEPGGDSKRITNPGWDPEGSGVLLGPQGPRRVHKRDTDTLHYMANVQLHPIVIQAIISGPFECLGEGLLHEGVGREEPNVLKDLIAPTKSSKRVAIEDRERPKKWWKGRPCSHIS